MSTKSVENKLVKNIASLAVIGTTLALLSMPAVAEEGALGRSVPGVWIMPQAGLVGPDPGFTFTVMPIGYFGSISGSTEIPIAGLLVAKASADTSVNYLVPEYVYPVEHPVVPFPSSNYLISESTSPITGFLP
jgi:hypothetical protein